MSERRQGDIWERESKQTNLLKIREKVCGDVCKGYAGFTRGCVFNKEGIVIQHYVTLTIQ